METILIVDDEEDVRRLLSDLLRNEGYRPITAGSGRRALRELIRRSPGLVLLDLRLPKMDGMKLLEEMKRIDKDWSIIMVTGYGDVKGAVRAIKLGAFDYITKPFDNISVGRRDYAEERVVLSYRWRGGGLLFRFCTIVTGKGRSLANRSVFGRALGAGRLQ